MRGIWELHRVSGLPFWPVLLWACIAQPAPEVSEFGSRYDAFCYILEEHGAQARPIGDFLAASDAWSDWAFIVLGNPNVLHRLELPWRRFLIGGGAILVATDRPITIPLLPHTPNFPALSYDVASTPIIAVRPEDQYKGNPNCPLVTDLANARVFEGVHAIAMNHPGILSGPKEGEMAWLPRDLRGDLPDRKTEKGWPVIAGGYIDSPDIDKGKFIVVADSSVFSNEMIQEADNTRFADNVASWILSNDKGKRKNVVVLFDGRELASLVDERFVSGDWIRPPPPSMIDLGNDLLLGLQSEDMFNRLAVDAQESLSWSGPWPVRQFALLFVAALFFLGAIWRILRARRPDPSIEEEPSGSKVWSARWTELETAAVIPAHGVLDRRIQEIRRTQNYIVPLRHAAVAYFDRRFADEPWKSHPPNVRGGRGLLFGWRDRQRLRTLWQIAVEGNAPHIGKREFQFWRDQMSKLDKMMRKGALRVTFASKTTPAKIPTDRTPTSQRSNG